MLTTDFVGVFARNWWVLLVRGIIAILFGLMALFMPGLTLAVLVLLCGVYFIIDGVMALLIGGRAHAWSLFIVGIIGVLAGVFTFIRPGITAITLLIVLAVWAVARGIFEILAAIRLRRQLTNEWLLVIAGALSIVFGILLFAYPAAGALAVVWLIGAYALIFGITLCVLAFRLRGRPERLIERHA